MLLLFHIHFFFSDLTHFGKDMGQCIQAQGCMHASLHAWIKLCAWRGPACSSDSIDTLISLIRPNLAEIWACARNHIGCMHARLCAWSEFLLRKLCSVLLIPNIL